MRLLAIFVLLLLGLAACGLKGDLVIPEKGAEQNQANNQTPP